MSEFIIFIRKESATIVNITVTWTMLICNKKSLVIRECLVFEQ